MASSAVKGVAAFVVAAGLVYGGWRVLVHSSNLIPALVTPQTNVHLELAAISSRGHIA